MIFRCFSERKKKKRKEKPLEKKRWGSKKRKEKPLEKKRWGSKKRKEKPLEKKRWGSKKRKEKKRQYLKIRSPGLYQGFASIGTRRTILQVIA